MEIPTLRAASTRSLRDTRSRYGQLIAAMKRAESKMPPVLNAFRDQVLFLKHNLNARAIASLEGTIGEIESDVASLIRDIDASIEEEAQLDGHMRVFQGEFHAGVVQYDHSRSA